MFLTFTQSPLQSAPIVTATNRPTAVADTAETDLNTHVDITVTANDTGTHAIDASSVEVIAQPEHGTAVFQGAGVIRYTPATGFSGMDIFNYRVRDVRGIASIPAAVTVKVNETPVPTSFANGYSHRARFRVPGRNVIGGGTLTDFLLFVDVTDDDLRDTDNSGVVESDDGFDLRWEDLNGNKLPHRIALYHRQSGRLVCFVKVSLNSNVAQTFYLYAGKAGLTETEADPNGAYSYLTRAWDTRTGIELTGRGPNLTPTGISTGTIIGDEAAFTDQPSFLEAAPWPDYAGASAVTLMTVSKCETLYLGQNRGQVRQGPGGNAANHSLALFQRATSGDAARTLVWSVLTTTGQVQLTSLANQQDDLLTVLHGRWRSTTAGGSGFGRLAKNGVDLAYSSRNTVAQSGTIPMATGTFCIGKDVNASNSPAAGNGSWYGEIAEVRLAWAEASDVQVATEAFSIRDPSGFYGRSALHAPASNQGPIAMPLRVTITQGQTIDVDVLAEAFDPDGDAMTLDEVGTATKGTVSIESGKARYTHTGTIGEDRFSFLISDEDGAESTGWVTVSISLGATSITSDVGNTLSTTVGAAVPTTLTTLRLNGGLVGGGSPGWSIDAGGYSKVALGTPAGVTVPFNLTTTPVTADAAATQTATVRYEGEGVNLSLTLSITVAAPIVIATPTALGTPVSETTALTSVTHGSVTPAANALVIAIVRTRGSSASTHNTPTKGFATLADFAKIEDEFLTNINVSAWWAITTAAPGSGTVVCTFNGNAFQRDIELWQITSNFNATSPIRQAKAGSNNTGTSLSLLLDSAPLANSMVMSAMAQNSGSAGISPGANFNELRDTQVSATTFSLHTQYDNENAGRDVILGGLNSGQVHTLIAWEIAAATPGVPTAITSSNGTSLTVAVGASVGAVLSSIGLNNGAAGSGDWSISGDDLGTGDLELSALTGTPVNLRVQTSPVSGDIAGSPYAVVITYTQSGLPAPLTLNLSVTVSSGAVPPTAITSTVTPPFSLLTGAAVNTVLSTLGLNNGATGSGTWAISGYSDLTLSAFTGATVNLKVGTTPVAADVGAKTVTVTYNGESANLSQNYTVNVSSPTADSFELVLAGKAKTTVTTWAALKTAVAAASAGSVICWTGSGTTTVNDVLTMTNSGAVNNPIIIMCGGDGAQASGGVVGARHLVNVGFRFNCNNVCLWGFKLSGRFPSGGSMVGVGSNVDSTPTASLNGQNIALHRVEITAWGGSIPNDGSYATGASALTTVRQVPASSHGVAVAQRCHGFTLNRCEIHHPLDWTDIEKQRGLDLWRNKNGVAAEVNKYNGFGILRMGLRVAGEDNARGAKNGNIRYSYFHHMIGRPRIPSTDENGAAYDPPGSKVAGDYDYHMGQCDYFELGSSGLYTASFVSGWLIDTCLFDNHLDEQPAGAVDIKMADVYLRNVTLDNSEATAANGLPTAGNFTFRGNGGNCTMERCYMTGKTDGSGVFGPDNVVLRCFFGAGSKLRVSSGSTSASADAAQPAVNTRIIGGSGQVHVGDPNGGSLNTVNATGTKIEGRPGAGGTYFTRTVYSWKNADNVTFNTTAVTSGAAGGYHETGTTYSATTSDTTPEATKLAASSVGVNS